MATQPREGHEDTCRTSPRSTPGQPGSPRPGAHADALAGLPADLAALTEVVHGLMVHEHMAGMYGFELAAEHRASVHVRAVSRLLDQILADDDRPLEVTREPSARVPGNCRHFSVFTVAALRMHGIPARARCGFGGYFGTGWYEDHWVCEYWNATAGRWTLADAQLDDVQREAFGIELDVLDVSRDDFLVAGDAWLRCRAGLADPGTFGVSPMNEAGYWWIADNLLRDVAALNNMEMLPWDVWGEMLGPMRARRGADGPLRRASRADHRPRRRLRQANRPLPGRSAA